MAAKSCESADLLQRARAGDQDALSDLLGLHRVRLAKMVRTRLNPRVRGRVDESDIVQESLLEAARRLPEYLAAPQSPFFLWLRSITGHRIIDIHRRHLGARARSVELEVSLQGSRRPASTSLCLAEQLLGRLPSPSQAIIREETRDLLERGIDAMDSIDREILALRHFEELTNREAAEELGIEAAAASKRYVRALQRLHAILHDLGLIEAAP